MVIRHQSNFGMKKTKEQRGDRSEESRKRYAKKRDELIAYQQRYRAENPEKVRGKDLAYKSKNRSRLSAQSTEYNRLNPVRHSVHVRNWGKKNPHKLRESSIKRRARVKKATIGDTSKITEWELSWKSKARVTCYWCRKRVSSKTCHSDHIHPLDKGGAHSVENLCISCQPCNNRKSTKTVKTWNDFLTQPVLLLETEATP